METEGMISEATLKYLIAKKVKDAKALLKNKRYPAAIYMAGYAVEIALKYRICKKLDFENGFPETSQEFATYVTNINRKNPGIVLISLWDIRHHNLGQLLLHSGERSRILNEFRDEWKIVRNWNPIMRYRKQRVLSKTAGKYLAAVNKLVKEFD